MPPRSPAPDPWSEAVRRATDATAADQPGGMDEQCWDDVAMRGIVATVLYALHLRERRPVDAIGWPAVLWQLRDDERVTELVTTVLPRAGHDLSRTAAPGDPVTECWRWLTRTWDPHAPVKSAFLQPALSHSSYSGWVPDAPEPRWGGMSRGIARGLPDPALEVCTHWAAGVVQRQMITERGHHALDRVKVTSGAFTGHRGYVRDVGWFFDDATETVHGPAGYVVDLDDVEGTQDIDADQVEACADLHWPHRPEGTLKDGPPPGLNDPLPPAKTCAEDLRELLDRAGNPDVVPEELRRAVAAAHHHHHLELDWQASPAPQRFTWRVLHHWYQLTEHYADDQRADLYEVVVTRYLRDAEPAHHLALSKDELPGLIARCTTGA
ncbi:hypothetical protein CIB93_04950 [Streptomyces sp. WZ.A104]|uniref:hypothetical protein n=1 Tax=Streptomyces sp. WZ.A104 TaxID=2023771 RepID=UPI000BBBFA15|nr:hypothetical protein [Streptomyces sp. WZ.A104]PCG87189.1 hypothetical protein CIB93_04950 [Streptomyces sp. WZ.A104]